MRLSTKKVSKHLGFIIAAISISLTSFSPVYAEDTGGSSTTSSSTEGTTTSTATDTASTAGGASGASGSGCSGDYLKQIAQNTKGILTKVNQLPGFIQELTTLAVAWLNPDTSTVTATAQNNFAQWANAVQLEGGKLPDYEQPLQKDLLGTGVTTTTVPYANDLTYSTLLGTPYFSPDPRSGGSNNTNPPDSAYNYIKNAASDNVSHILPPTNVASQVDYRNYVNYYSTISAVQTYNCYTLSQLYADYKNNNQLTTLQSTLITQASSSDWFAQVASESIGIVLRQILMYNSQIYVMLTQSLATQKQLLATQAMTNSLLVILNLYNENTLVKRATGAIKS